jgi:hypothetical protein
MHGRRWRRAAWRGWLISLLLHALVAAGLIVGLRHTSLPVLKSRPDNLWTGKDLELVIGDWDEPVRIRESKTAPPSSPNSSAPVTPPPGPIVPVEVAPKALPADLDSAPPLQLVDPHAAASKPVEVPRGTGGTTANPGTVRQASNTSGSGIGQRSRLPVSSAAKSVVFVLDCSASMGIDDRFALARAQILACLRLLPSTARFQVVYYNSRAETVSLDGKTGLVPVNARNTEQLANALEEMVPEGGNNDETALRAALNLDADVVCLLTDADNLSKELVWRVTAWNRGRSAIHAVTVGSAPRDAMRLLAAQNRGTCLSIAIPNR